MLPVRKLLARVPFPLWVLVLGFVCYAWALDNGFMSDDLVQLDQSGHLVHLRAQLNSAPNAFRLTAFAWFAGLQWVFGYQPVAFYFFSIILHCLNALLLRRVLVLRGIEPGLALLTALLFLVMQNPSEAVGWLSAVNELLVGFFVLSVLWAVHSRRYALCLAFYVGALLSKESGAVIMLLLPVFAWMPGQRNGRLNLPRWLWISLAGITIAFVARFVSLVETNFLIRSHFYSVKPNSLLVLGFSLHKLALPWLYLALVSALIFRKRPIQASASNLAESSERHTQGNELTLAAIWMVAALLPYIFMIYDTHVPSRQMYLAAMPAAYLFARLVGMLPIPWVRWSLVAVFAAANIGYLWLVKDAQYWTRGATTRALISILRTEQPRCLVVKNFPENPWIAKLSARFVPGWSPDMIKVDETAEISNCMVLRWDADQNRYLVLQR